MLEIKIAKAKKGVLIFGLLSLVGLFLLMAGLIHSWIAQAIVIALMTRVIYGWSMLKRLQREQKLTSI